MSLTRKRKMTAKNLAAHRRNGPRSRGAVTPAGKARAAKANLRHGFYSQAQDAAMIALGEDPAEYARMLNSVADSLEPAAGIESEVVKRMVRALWRMQRAERMQDGLALKRVRSGLQKEDLMAGPRMLEVHGIYEGLCAISRMLNRENPTPGPGEIEALEIAFGDNPPADVRSLFPLLRAYGEAAAPAPGRTNESGESGPFPSAAGAQEKQSRHQKLYAALDEVIMPYAKHREVLMGMYDQTHSAENVAALMAPRDESTLLMQRMEDASLRQLWRLTNLFMKIRDGALSPKDVNNVESSG